MLSGTRAPPLSFPQIQLSDFFGCLNQLLSVQESLYTTEMFLTPVKGLRTSSLGVSHFQRQTYGSTQSVRSG